MGETPPMTWPVCSRTKSGVARLSLLTPSDDATFAVSTRWAPDVRMSTGVESASKSRLFAIAPTSHPSASAASAAVCTESGRMTISPVPPRRAWSSRNRVIVGCSVFMVETLGQRAAPGPTTCDEEETHEPGSARIGEGSGLADPGPGGPVGDHRRAHHRLQERADG